jgi:hypothetical protein
MRLRWNANQWSRVVLGGLGVVLVVEIALLALHVVRPLPTVTAPVVPSGPSDASAPPQAPDVLVPSLARSAPAGLFALPAAGSGPGESRQPPSGSATELASRLTLLGIVAGDPPQAIIEDSKTKKTHFVSTGQTVAEGAVLEQVLGTYVILDFQGEKIELTL